MTEASSSDHLLELYLSANQNVRHVPDHLFFKAICKLKHIELYLCKLTGTQLNSVVKGISKSKTIKRVSIQDSGSFRYTNPSTLGSAFAKLDHLSISVSQLSNLQLKVY